MSVWEKKREERNKEKESSNTHSQIHIHTPNCPECQSSKVWKDGLRYIQGEPIQRFLCRSCGYRFSDNYYKECQTTYSRQICVLDEKAKNLVRANQKNEALRETKQQLKGEIIQFGWYMKKRELSEATIEHRCYRLEYLIKKGADLHNPTSIETIVATSGWSKANKKVYLDCYKAYCIWKKIEWDKPRIKVPQKQPFLPLEEEVQQFIAGCGKITGTLLQLLYETGVRVGEASALTWKEIDFKAKTLMVNFPEKGGASRTLEISDVLISMLNALPKRSDGHIFTPKARSLGSSFQSQRNRIAKRLNNPRLKDIHLHTLRHLRATLTYYETGGDILRVKYLLGHRKLDTTSRYAHYQAIKKGEYMVKRPQTKEEEDQLILEEWELVRTDVDINLGIYRKRK